ncbi:GGDEF domain-containing protein [Pseudoduganella violacea]|uniref:diguanylate cyclase n=1 Tax=Pseudoduganella violacea TaxID=1715466 RepID=A0A7W5BC59_9BURK|nr:GGDEF domain-containing protein [Pseudoduganella violacea]MBB3120414.1 diguanylate cyclase (GGDEF)-like protein [Pseudoduganella violacea]
MIMTTLMCAVMSVVLYSVHRSAGREVQGLDQWAAGLLALAPSIWLYKLYGILPDPVIVPIANGVVLWGLGRTMLGTQMLLGRRPSWLLFHAGWAGGASLLCWFAAISSFPLRIAVFSVVAFSFYAVQIVAVLRYGARHFSSYFFTGLLALQALPVLARGVMALTADLSTVDLQRGSALATVYLAVANMMSLLLAVGFLMMAMRRLQTVLERRSTHDPLTNVLNRRGFGACYDAQLALLRREGRPLALMHIDLDHFKKINDRYGHSTGDQVLVHAAGAIRYAVRECDYVARFGGEEFVVLLPDSTLKAAAGAAERIQNMLRELRGAHLPAYTASIGIACQYSSHESLDNLLARADVALYRAKANGRNRVELDDDPCSMEWCSVA